MKDNLEIEMRKEDLKRSRLKRGVIGSLVVGSMLFFGVKDTIQNNTREKLYPQVVALADENKNGSLDKGELSNVYDLIGKDENFQMKYGFNEKYLGNLSAKDMKRYISMNQ